MPDDLATQPLIDAESIAVTITPLDVAINEALDVVWEFLYNQFS